MFPQTSRPALGPSIRRARETQRLTQESLADQAGVGGAWLASVEDGDSTGLTELTLSWVCDALGLRGHERRRMFEAAGLRDRELASVARVERPGANLVRILDALLLPAYVVGRRQDLLAWNESAAAIYRCESLPSDRRNLLLFLFLVAEARRLVMSWEAEARRAVETFRPFAESDRWHASLLARLEGGSADFRRMWRSPKDAPDRLQKGFVRRGSGVLTFDEEIGAFGNGLSMHIYVPTDARTAAGLKKLVRAHRLRKQHVSFLRNMRAVERVRAYIDENFARPVSLEELSRVLGIEKTRLLRMFARENGMPPHAYQLLVRIDRARLLLLDGVPQAQLALDVGFADQSHFSRHFRRVEGITPAQFARGPRDKPVGRLQSL